MRHLFHLWESLRNREYKINPHFLEELRRSMRAYSLTISFGRTTETCCAVVLSACGQEGNISTCDVALAIFFRLPRSYFHCDTLVCRFTNCYPFRQRRMTQSRPSDCLPLLRQAEKWYTFVHLRWHFSEWVRNTAGVILTG